MHIYTHIYTWTCEWMCNEYTHEHIHIFKQKHTHQQSIHILKSHVSSSPWATVCYRESVAELYILLQCVAILLQCDAMSHNLKPPHSRVHFLLHKSSVAACCNVCCSVLQCTHTAAHPATHTETHLQHTATHCNTQHINYPVATTFTRELLARQIVTSLPHIPPHHTASTTLYTRRFPNRLLFRFAINAWCKARLCWFGWNVCMCVCVCVCVCLCQRVWTRDEYHIYTHVHRRRRKHTLSHTRTHTHTHTLISTHTHVQICVTCDSASICAMRWSKKKNFQRTWWHLFENKTSSGFYSNLGNTTCILNMWPNFKKPGDFPILLPLELE